MSLDANKHYEPLNKTKSHSMSQPSPLSSASPSPTQSSSEAAQSRHHHHTGITIIILVIINSIRTSPSIAAITTSPTPLPQLQSSTSDSKRGTSRRRLCHCRGRAGLCGKVATTGPCSLYLVVSCYILAQKSEKAWCRVAATATHLLFMAGFLRPFPPYLHLHPKRTR